MSAGRTKWVRVRGETAGPTPVRQMVRQCFVRFCWSAAASRSRKTGRCDWNVRAPKQPLTIPGNLVMRHALLDGELTRKIKVFEEADTDSESGRMMGKKVG